MMLDDLDVRRRLRTPPYVDERGPVQPAEAASLVLASESAVKFT
jgi:hypothetical protein